MVTGPHLEALLDAVQYWKERAERAERERDEAVLEIEEYRKAEERLASVARHQAEKIEVMESRMKGSHMVAQQVRSETPR